ncbi:MAG: serine hydrolase domain-containing protein [Acidimicrobiales bacterium]|nr:serine hydrolase domain-containing protein [Acidimicrobiales bacterium]
MGALDLLHDWPVEHAAGAVIVDGMVEATTTDVDRPFALASVTKLITALVALVAHEEGTLELDEEITAAGATAADLLAHAGGVAPDDDSQLAAPHRRRIYSTHAYDMIAEAIATRAAMPYADYAREAVLEPLAMTETRLLGSAGAGAWSTVRDLTHLVRAWREPIVVGAPTLARATSPHLPDLAGVLPGFGRHDPNPWGLGPEIRGHKDPHWTGFGNAPSTFGHFGQTGTFLWVDPAADIAVVVLTDRSFGEWATQAWPVFADAILPGT